MNLARDLEEIALRNHLDVINANHRRYLKSIKSEEDALLKEQTRFTSEIRKLEANVASIKKKRRNTAASLMTLRKREGQSRIDADDG